MQMPRSLHQPRPRIDSARADRRDSQRVLGTERDRVNARRADATNTTAVQRLRVDRGQARDVSAQNDSPALLLGAASRSASLCVADHSSFWLVLRGNAHLECQEGQFALRAGEWISLDRDSRPTLQAGRTALVLALLLPASIAPEPSGGPVVYPGRGRSTLHDRRLAFQLWRAAGVFASSLDTTKPVAPALLKRIVHLLTGMQEEFESLLSRCPGRSLRRRRQVLARMQRARLYLDGHLSRNVRLSELAQLTIFSTWYFTKTFHAVYDEGPRDVVSRLRLRRASTLLVQTDLSIAEVGEACGFENPCSFARAFRASYGVTASLYRGSKHCA
jgi:AraC family transcriptional regulator